MKTSPVPLLAAMILISSNHAIHAESEPWAWRGQSITEFSAGSGRNLEWQVVNDGVMGGLSKGKVEITAADTMRFTGTLSLENNGGFSTVRSERVDLNLTNDLGILLRVKGDGRTYEFRLESDATYRGRPVSFAGEFKTRAGQWQQVRVPFSDFEGSWRGTDLPEARLNPAVIRQVGILLADKKPGSFELEVEWIRTYGKGQGDYTERKTEARTSVANAETESSGTVIDTIASDGRFSVLAAALEAAGISTFFQWDNPKTVFAPTDEAFAALPDGTMETLLKPENKKRLVAILSYHVHPGASDLAKALSISEVKTVEGASVKVAFVDGRVRVDQATLREADLDCQDGVIHVIDSVLIPPTFAGALEAGS